MEKISFFAILISCLVLLSGLGACMRYVPSRKELASQNRSNPIVDAISGPEVFDLHNQDQIARLNALLSERQRALQGQPSGVYKLGSGDLLKMEVLGLNELSTEFAVEPSGVAKLHLIGEVQFANREVWQVRQEITDRLRKYLRDPQVKLSLSQVRSNRVSVVGEIKSPGVYPLTSVGLTISDILAQAGGRSERAGSQLVLIPAAQGAATQAPSDSSLIDTHTLLPEDSERKGVTIEFDRIYGNADSGPLMLPLISGDVIVVPEAGKVSVDGEVNNPGSYQLGSGTTVLGAVAAAGGLTYAAKIGEVELVRNIGQGKRAMLILDLEKLALNSDHDIKVINGDLLRVPSDSGRFERRQVVEVINRIFKVGVSGGVK